MSAILNNKTTAKPKLAGFWIRFLASVIDCLFLMPFLNLWSKWIFDPLLEFWVNIIYQPLLGFWVEKFIFYL